MKIQALFSPQDKSQKLKCRLLQFLFGALRVKLSSNEFVLTCWVCWWSHVHMVSTSRRQIGTVAGVVLVFHV